MKNRTLHCLLFPQSRSSVLISQHQSSMSEVSVSDLPDTRLRPDVPGWTRVVRPRGLAEQVSSLTSGRTRYLGMVTLRASLSSVPTQFAFDPSSNLVSPSCSSTLGPKCRPQSEKVSTLGLTNDLEDGLPSLLWMQCPDDTPDLNCHLSC